MSDDLKLPYQPKILNVPTTSTGEVIDKTQSPNSNSPVEGNQEPPSITDLFKQALDNPGIKKSSTDASFTQSYDYNSAAPFMQGFGHSGFIGNESAEYNAQNQRYYHQLANGISKGLGLAGTTLISGTVGTLNGVFDVVNSMAQGKPNLSKLYDNDVNTAMDQFNQHMEKWFPNYYSKKELEAPALSADNLLTMNFFADKLIKNAGFAAGAILEGYLTAGLASATGLGKLSWGYRNAVRLGKIESMAMSQGDDAVAMGKQLLDFASKQTRNLAQIENANINKMATFLSTMGEASMEAYEGKKRIREELITQQTQILGRDLTANELQQIEERAETSGNLRMALNVALLNVTNSIQFPKILNGGFKGERQALGREINEIAVNGLDNSVIGKTAKTGQSYIAKLQADKLKGIEKIWDYSKKAATIISPSETFEEGSQYIFDKATARNAGVMTEDEVEKAKSSYSHNVNDFMNRSSDPMKMAEFEDVISSSVKSLFNDKEGIESMILGGLTGGIMEKIGGGDRKESARKTQNTNNAINLFNNNLASGYMQEMAKSGVTSLSIEEDKMNKIASGDIMGSQNLREDAFINFAMPRLFYGRGDMAKDELMQYHSSQMKFEDAKKELGLADDMTSEKLDAIAENSVKDLEKLEKILTHVEAVSPMLFGKDGTINPLAKGLLYAGYKIDSFENRINTMVAELNKIGLTEANLLLDPKARKEAGYDFESLRNKLNAEIKSVAGKIIDPVTKLPIDVKEYQDKVNDVERLQNLRESYITDYAQLKDGSFFSNQYLSYGVIPDDLKLNDYEKFENYMLGTQRNLEYQKNTKSRKAASILSNAIESFLTNNQPFTEDSLNELYTLLDTQLSGTYLMEQDKAHIQTLLTELKNKVSDSFNSSAFPNTDADLLKDIQNTLNGVVGSKSLDAHKSDLAFIVDNMFGTFNDKQVDEADKIFKLLENVEDKIISFNQFNDLLNRNIQEPTSKTIPDLKKEIANMFTNKAKAVSNSFALDASGFTNIQDVEDSIKMITNLKRLFSERPDSFYEENKKSFKSKKEYIEELNNLLEELKFILEETKKNSENLEKDDLNFAINNRNQKALLFGYDIIENKIVNQEIYDLVSNVVSKAILDDLLQKHSKDSTNKYIYELYEKFKIALDKDSAIGTNIKNVLKTKLTALEKPVEDLESIITGLLNSKLIFKHPFKFYDFFLSTYFSKEVNDEFIKSGDINRVIELLKTNKGTPISSVPYFTDAQLLTILENAEQQKRLHDLNSLIDLNSDFSFTKYWDALEATMVKTTNGITPTERQLQTVEDMVMHLFTDSSNSDFSNWIYLNGRIGSGKTKIIAATVLQVVSEMSKTNNLSEFAYLMGDTKIAGFNLEHSLRMYQTGIPEVVTGLEGRDIQQAIADLENDHKDLKGKRFIIADEFARPKLEDLKLLNKALNDYNIRNKTSLKLLAMGDTNQSSNSAKNTNILTISPSLNLANPLRTSYRSTIFSINVVQSLFDNAKTRTVKEYRNELVNLKTKLMNSETDPIRKDILKRQIDNIKKAIDVVSLIEKDSNDKEVIGGYRYGVTGVQPNTNFKTAEDNLIQDLVLRSNKINLPADTSLPVSESNPILNGINLAVIVNANEVESFKKKLEAAGAKLQNIIVLNIEQAQGQTFTEVYVHIDPNASEYSNGVDTSKYNSDMYTALRAQNYIHITTLETNNVNDEALKTRNTDLVEKMKESGKEVRAHVNAIKMHLNPNVATASSSSASGAAGTVGSTKVTATGLTVIGYDDYTSKIVLDPKASNKDEQEKKLTSLKEKENEINSLIKDINEEYKKLHENNLLVDKIQVLKDQLAAETDPTKKADLEKQIKDLGTPLDNVKLNEDIKDLIEELELLRDDANTLLNELNVLISKGVPASSIPLPPNPNDQLINFTITLGNELPDSHTSTNDTKTEFPYTHDDTHDPQNVVNVAFPTNSALYSQNIESLDINSDIIIMPVLKNGKQLTVVYRKVTIDNSEYYQELGNIDNDLFNLLLNKNLIKDSKTRVVTKPYVNPALGIIANNNIFELTGSDEEFSNSVEGKVSNMETLHYNYAYGNTTPKERDGREYKKLVELWATQMGKDINDLSYTIQTISEKEYKDYLKTFKMTYGDENDNKIAIKPGRTYIVITDKKGTSKTQYIELEPRTLIVDDALLTLPENIMMSKFYITPLKEFTKSVDNYNTALNRILTKFGITQNDIDQVLNAAKQTKVINGQSITVTEEVETFEQGNSFYNDLMYAFVNMSYFSTNEKTWFSKKGNALYKKEAGLFYNKLFSVLHDPANIDTAKQLMLLSRDVYSKIHGQDLVEVDKSLVKDLPEIDLKNTKFVLGGAQMAMNLIAFGNQKVEVEINGEIHRISTGRTQTVTKNNKQRIEYNARPLNDRKGLEISQYRPKDRLALWALLNRLGETEIKFNGYQDELIIKEFYDKISKEDSSVLPYNVFMNSFLDFIKKENITTTEEFDNNISKFLENSAIKDSWDAYQLAAVKSYTNHKSIGHNASSISASILNNTGLDGSRNELGNKTFGENNKVISLRMNIPYFMSNVNSQNNWQKPANPSSTFLPMQVSPEERFKMFFTSSFTGVSQTKLEVVIPDLNNSIPTTPTAPTAPVTPSAPIIIPPPPVPSAPANSNKSGQFYKGIELTNDEYNAYVNNQDVYIDGNIINKKNDDLDTPIPFLRVTEESDSNIPSGDTLQHYEDMFNYLKNFIPNLTRDDLRIITSMQSANMFGPQNGTVYGAFKDGVIYAVQNKPNDALFKQVLKHEAFHKIFRNYLNESERRIVIQEAKEEYDLWGKTDLEIEEFLAVNFQKRPDFKRDSLLQRFLNFLKRLYYLIYRHGNAIESLYSKIEEGGFKKEVSEEFKSSNIDVAFLSTLEYFKNQEHLIGELRGMYNQMKISVNTKSKLSEIKEYTHPNNQPGIQIVNGPLSEMELVQKTIEGLKSKLSKFKSRFINNYGKTDEDRAKILIAKKAELNASDYEKEVLLYTPLTDHEFLQYEALQKVFSKRIYNSLSKTYSDPFKDDSFYPYLLRFISDIYPSDLRNVKSMMQYNKVIGNLEKNVNASIDELEALKESDVQVTSQEEFEQLRNQIEKQKEVNNILSDILGKDDSIDPYKTLTDSTKSWISSLFVINKDGSRSPINVKQALAILYQSFRLFDVSSFENFQNDLLENMPSISFVSQSINDFAFINKIIKRGSGKEYMFLKRLTSTYGIALNVDNIEKIGNLLSNEVINLVNNITEKGEYTVLSKPNNSEFGRYTIFDLYANQEFEKRLDKIYQNFENVKSYDKQIQNSYTDKNLLIEQLTKEIDKAYNYKLRGLQTRMKNEKELTPELIEKYKTEEKDIIYQRDNEILLETQKINALSEKEASEKSVELRKKLKNENPGNVTNLKKYKTKGARKPIIKLGIDQGSKTQYGKPTDMVIYNRLIELADTVFKDTITVNGKKVSLNTDYYFINENEFYLYGNVIRRPNFYTPNSVYFGLIYQYLVGNPSVDNSKIDSEQIIELYKKVKANNLFLDIVTNFNSLVPANLTRFELKSEFGNISSSGMNMKTMQENDMNYKTMMNITDALLQKIKISKNGKMFLSNAELKTFYNDNFKDLVTNIPFVKYDPIIKEFLEMIGLSSFYVESTKNNEVSGDTKSAIEAIRNIIEIIAKHDEFRKGDIPFDLDSEFDPSVLFNDMTKYSRDLTSYLNKNKEIITNSVTKDINNNTRNLRDRTTYSDGLITIINRFNSKKGHNVGPLLEIFKNRYPQLMQNEQRFNYMSLNPFNPLADARYSKSKTKVKGDMHTLDGTLSNDYPIEMAKESMKDILNRMFNGHFLGAYNKFTSGNNERNVFATSYPISNKTKLKMVPTTVYSLQDTGVENEASVGYMIKLMIQQRLMMPKTNDVLAYYSVWKDRKDQFILGGLEKVDSVLMKNLMELTGSFNTMEELEAANIDYTPFVDAIYNNIKKQASEVADYILESNLLALDSTNNQYLNGKYAIPIPSDLDAIYTKMLKYFPMEAFSNDSLFEIVKVKEQDAQNDSEKDTIVLKDFNSNGKNYNVSKGHILPLIELFTSNTYINDFFLNQLTMGDSAFIEDAVTVVKRLSIPHGNIISPLVSPVHAIDKIRTIVTDDIVTYTFKGTDFSKMPAGTIRDYTKEDYFNYLSTLSIEDRELVDKNFAKRKWTDGGGMISLRGRDALNKGYGESNKMGNSIKPLAHRIDPILGPASNKYALTVLTDELCKQFPLMFEQRMKMDFHGLNAEDYARAYKLEKNRLELGYNFSITETHELNTLYQKATPIIQAIPPSSIKFGGIKNTVKFNYDTRTYDSFTDDSILYMNTQDWGYQLDPEDEVNSKVSLPTQLLYFANVNGRNSELENDIIESIAGLQDLQSLEYQKFDIDGLDTSIQSVSKYITSSLEGKENQLNTMQALELNAKMLNLPVFTTSGTSTYNNIFEKKMLKLKFSGTKGVQVSEALTTDLKGETLEWDEVTQTAEVYMPSTYIDMISMVLPDLYKEYRNEKNAVKKHDLEKQIIEALPVLMVGFRIPSTGLNSAVRIKIKGFIHDNSNRIILPNELVYRMGSDFDIDTLYILKPELVGTSNRDNVIAQYLGLDPKYPIGFRDYEGTKISNFIDKLNALNTVTTIEGDVITYENRERKVVKRTYTINKNDIDKFKKAYYKNVFTMSYVRLLKDENNNKEVNKALSFDRATSIKPSINIDMNTNKEIESDSLYVLLAGLKDSNFKKDYELAKKDKSLYDPKVQEDLEKRMLKIIEKDYNLTNIFDRANIQILNQTGSTLTGIFASASKTLAYIQSALNSNFEISESLQFTVDGVTYGNISNDINKDVVVIKDENGNDITVPNKQKNRFFDTNKVFTFDELQWLVNAAVDNAKEQILAKLNINSVTSDVVTSALLVGFPMESQLILLQQPVVKELIRLGNINGDSIRYIRKKFLKMSGKDISNLSSEDILNLVKQTLNASSFGMMSETNKRENGKIYLQDYVNAEYGNKIKPQLSLVFKNLKDTDFLSPKFNHVFTYDKKEYNNLNEAVKDIQEAYEESISTATTGSEKEKFKHYRNLAYKQLLNTYFKSFPDELLNEFNSIKSIKVNTRDAFQQAFLDEFEEFKKKRYDEYVHLNPNTLDDNNYFASQLFALDLLDKLTAIGRSTELVRKSIKLLSDNPNSQTEILQYEHVINDIFYTQAIYTSDKNHLSSEKEYGIITLPSTMGVSAHSTKSLVNGVMLDGKKPGTELRLKDSFAIKNLDFSKIGNGLFKNTYDYWYRYDYAPIKKNVMLLHPTLEQLSTKIQTIYKVNPTSKGGVYLSKFEKDMLIRTQILKALLSKMIIRHSDINGVTIATKTDTVGLKSKDGVHDIYENESLYKNLIYLIRQQMVTENNKNNEFLMKMSAQKFNSFTRTGEIVMNRSNTSDPNELKSMQSSFMQIDNDLRQEFKKNNPNSKDYWFSPLQIEIIKYAVAFEGLTYGSSKMTQFIPHGVLNQFSEQLDVFFKDLISKDSFKYLEEWLGFYFAAADPTWTRNIRFKNMLSIEEQLEIIGSVDKEDAELVDVEESEKGKTEEEKEEKDTKRHFKGKTVKYDEKRNAYYHLAFKREENKNINSFPLFVHDGFKGKNLITYIRLDVEIPDMIYYLAVPKTLSITPKIPNSVLQKGFSLSAITKGNLTFFNENVINEDKGNLFFYNNAILTEGAFIHTFDPSKGYIQNLTKYKIVKKTGTMNDEKYQNVLDKLRDKKSRLSEKEKVELQSELQDYSFKYLVEKVEEDIPIQNNGNPSNSTLFSSEISLLQSDANNMLVKSLATVLDTNNRNTFNPEFYTDEELEYLNEVKKQITCNK
jgi:hypothetical protein